MVFAFVSDVHIEKEKDEKCTLLKMFFEHPLVQDRVTDIVLLGDIFDFMCGKYTEYFQLYPSFFDKIKELLSKKKKIHYFEGNHDFHLTDLFRDMFAAEIKAGFFKIYTKDHIFSSNGKSLYVSHGDFLYIGDFSYKIYLHTIKSKIVYRILNFMLNFQRVKKIGDKETNKSKEKRKDKTTDWEQLKWVYRKAILRIHKKMGSDFYIFGHSHVKDEFHFEDGQKKCLYLNNGYLKDAKTFLFLENGQHKFIDLFDNGYSKSN